MKKLVLSMFGMLALAASAFAQTSAMNVAASQHNNYLTTVQSRIQPNTQTFSQGVATQKTILSQQFAGTPGYDVAVDFANNCTSVPTTNQTIYDMTETILQDEFWKLVYIDIKNVLTTFPDEETFKHDMMTIWDKYRRTCPPILLPTFERSCGVAMGSYEYWKSSLEDWRQITIEGEPEKQARQTDKEKIRDFVLADFTGGSLGGLAGAAICSGIVAWAWD